MSTNYLVGKSVYLCGNIKNAHLDGVGWRDAVTPTLETFGIKVLDPCKKTSTLSEIGEQKKRYTELSMKEDWKTLKEEFWPAVRWDLKSVDMSDFIIFNYDPTLPTVGSIHELVVATFEKKPILLKYDATQLDKFNPWIATFIKEKHFFKTWESMFLYLEDVNNGIFDSSYWVF